MGDDANVPSARAGRWLRPAQLISLLLLPLLGGAILYLLHGAWEPAATAMEFITQLKGVGAVVSVFALFVVSPIVFVAFGKAPAVGFWRDRLIRVCFSTTRASIVTAAFLLVSTGITAGFGAHVHRSPTTTDNVAEEAFTSLYLERPSEARAALTQWIEKAKTVAFFSRKASLLALSLDVDEAERVQRTGRDWWFQRRALAETAARTERRDSFYHHLLVGRILLNLREFAEAQNAIREAFPYINTPERRVIAGRLYGDVELKSGHYDHAEVTYSSVLTIAHDRQKAFLLERIAVCRFERRAWADAEQAMKMALELNPERRAIGLSNLGLIQVFAGKQEDAVRTLQASLDLEPEDAVTELNLAIAEEETGEHETARSAVAAAQRILRKRSMDAETTSDRKLAGLLEAWIWCRKGGSRGLTRAVIAIDAADGLTTSAANARAVVGRSNALVGRLEHAADEILIHQHHYGLEFVAGDFLREALHVATDEEARARLDRRVKALPPSAQS